MEERGEEKGGGDLQARKRAGGREAGREAGDWRPGTPGARDTTGAVPGCFCKLREKAVLLQVLRNTRESPP